MSRGIKVIFIFGAIFVLFVLSLWVLIPIFQFTIIKKIFNYVVQNFVNVSGMSPWLAKGLVILLLIPFVWALLEITKLNVRLFKKRKSYRKVGILIIVAYFGLFFLSMFFLSRGTYFGHTGGEAMKFYAVTPEGIRFFDSPGFDPKYGIELKPVTQELINQYERSKRGMKPRRIDASKEIEFFDSITGEPKIWYCKDSKGSYEFFDQPGFHPVYWEELKPATKDVVLDYKNRMKEKELELTRQRKEEEEIKKRREEERKREAKIAEKKAYIESNINPVISNKAARIEVAVAIADKKSMGQTSSSRLLGSKIGEKLTNENLKAISNLFKSKFFSNGNYKDLYQGAIQEIFDLELINHLDYLVCGTIDSSFSKDQRLGDLVSCALSLDLKIYSIKTGEIISSNSFKDAGVGIDNSKAEQQAIERIASKVEGFISSKINK